MGAAGCSADRGGAVGQMDGQTDGLAELGTPMGQCESNVVAWCRRGLGGTELMRLMSWELRSAH